MNEIEYKKIVIITQDYFPDIGGITTWCYEIAKGFENSGKEVIIVTKSYSGYLHNSIIKKDEYNLNVIRLDNSKWKNKRNILVYKSIKQFIDKDTLFIAANWKMAVPCYFHSLFRKINYITAVHGLDAIENRKVNKFLQYRAFKNSKFVIAVSKFTKKLLESHFPNKNLKIEIVNGGVDLLKYRKIDDISSIKKKYNISDGFKIISLARLVKRKGFDSTIKALSLINDKNIHYYIAGKGNYEKELQLLVKELKLENNVHFLGFIPDDEIAALYSSCDVYSMPSRQLPNDVEGFGLTYLEAAACGITSIGGLDCGAEDAIINNETGLLVNAESVQEIAYAIISLKNDSEFKNKLADNAYKRVQKDCSWERKIGEIENLIDN